MSKQALAWCVLGVGAVAFVGLSAVRWSHSSSSGSAAQSQAAAPSVALSESPPPRRFREDQLTNPIVMERAAARGLSPEEYLATRFGPDDLTSPNVLERAAAGGLTPEDFLYGIYYGNYSSQADKLINAAMAMLGEGKFEEGIAMLEAVSNDSSHQEDDRIEAIGLMAAQYRKKGDDAEARRLFQRTVDEDLAYDGSMTKTGLSVARYLMQDAPGTDRAGEVRWLRLLATATPLNESLAGNGVVDRRRLAELVRSSDPAEAERLLREAVDMYANVPQRGAITALAAVELANMLSARGEKQAALDVLARGTIRWAEPSFMFSDPGLLVGFVADAFGNAGDAQARFAIMQQGVEALDAVIATTKEPGIASSRSDARASLLRTLGLSYTQGNAANAVAALERLRDNPHDPGDRDFAERYLPKALAAMASQGGSPIQPAASPAP